MPDTQAPQTARATEAYQDHVHDDFAAAEAQRERAAVLATRRAAKAETSSDAVLAELRGLSGTMNARFDGVAVEQSDMRAWMGRLSATMEHQAALTSQFLGFQIRLGSIDGLVTDLKLDIAGLREAATDEKVHRQSTAVLRTTLVGIIAAAVGAIISATVPHLLGVK